MDDTPYPRRTHGTPPTSARDGSSHADLQGLRRKWEKLTSESERWRWHAYDRVWRKHMGYSLPSPCDPDRQWANAELDAEAEREWRREHPYAMEAEKYERPTWAPADRVRPGWEKIRSNDLTEAERELSQAAMTRMSERLSAMPIRRMP